MGNFYLKIKPNKIKQKCQKTNNFQIAIKCLKVDLAITKTTKKSFLRVNHMVSMEIRVLKGKEFISMINKIAKTIIKT